jgi:hypothetical protein
MKRWLPIAFLSCIVAFSACNRPVETQNLASLPRANPALQVIDSEGRKCVRKVVKE